MSVPIWALAALGVVVVALAGALGWSLNRDVADAASPPSSRPAAATSSAPTPPATTAAPVDPYEVYLATNPDPSLILSREDAQARAYLGCGVTWAPGTIDAALADAYRPTGICG